MNVSDVPEVFNLANQIHLDYPEDLCIFLERQALSPCFVLEDKAIVGYCISHPYVCASVPLNTLLGSLPVSDSWYIHDLAILEEYRGRGHATTAINMVKKMALDNGYHQLTLTSVADTFWEHHGFIPISKSYGVFMCLHLDIMALDISSYDCVYVSFGSKSPNGSEPHFEQSNPYFLKHLSSRYLCIAIDPGFKKQVYDHFVTLPVLSDAEAQRLSTETYQYKLDYSKRKTEELTRQIVQLLKPSQRVFFVNFIQFVNPNAHDAIKVDIFGQLGPFQKDYYEWGGYRYPHLIIKQMCEDIPKKTGVVKIPCMIRSDRGYKFPGDKDPNVLSRMYNDFSNPTGFLDGIDPVYAVNILLKCVIDIRQESQLQLEALKIETPSTPTK